ncbi:MAG: hypothetical protein U1F77_03470 [Kiritimatiellia bacterium]
MPFGRARAPRPDLVVALDNCGTATVTHDGAEHGHEELRATG